MDDKTLSVLAKVERFAKEHGGFANIPPESGRFLHLLALASKAKAILEVGTSTGYSTIWLADALRTTGGKLITFERNPQRAQWARESFREAGVEGYISLRQGDALAGLPKLKGPFDLAFLDADKKEHLDYFQLAFPKVRAGGLVVSDNAISHQKELKAFLKYVRGSGRGLWETSLVPIGSGLEVTLKLRDLS
jgi:predicted O-methyltransferase YrrM